jgi:hypothetical protein
MTVCTAFIGTDRLAHGSLIEVALAVKAALARDPAASILTFDDATGRVVDLDLRGSEADLVARLAPPPEDQPVRNRGRPKLGVVAREVTLLPRHWEWLAGQPGGASHALRRLVEEARRRDGGQNELRLAQETAYRFLSALAGNLPGFEEATRALFANDAARFAQHSALWPVDIREHAQKLAWTAG